ncbi:hypothetical protein [Parabacteroides sp. FAFU027]|uniref:hypothetical protein n=1 Tax=Parabacteroides sp. FAFU027 TaxID=2922715 RepID=UPI001FAEF20A|nr:hypothetical protein [Parabacteroides sp. FAFU027]
MGITIHYRGRFNPAANLSEMIDEIEDIARTQGWEYFIFEREFPVDLYSDRMTLNHPITDNIYGISFSPPHCEAVQFSFLSNGRMSNPLNLQLYGQSTNPQEQEFLYMLFTKTQFTGVKTHMVIVALLRYLSNKYLSEFVVNDEGEYRETGDKYLLESNFRKVENYIDLVQNSFEAFPIHENESIEQYVDRLMGYIFKNK